MQFNTIFDHLVEVYFFGPPCIWLVFLLIHLRHSLSYKLTDSPARFDYWRGIFKGFRTACTTCFPVPSAERCAADRDTP